MFAEVSEKVKHCAHISIYNVSETIKPKMSTKDFIRNDSLSIFKL